MISRARMTTSEPLRGLDRNRLLEELYQRYGNTNSLSNRLFFLRKKYSWVFVVGGAKAIKRFFDIILSLAFLVGLSPLTLVIALLIKLTDRGPVFFVQTRVGKWGEEFAMPKFRTMIVGADGMKERLQTYNETDDGITFKIRKDPRITPIGKFLRRTSLDELPQLWCVVQGKMSLVGPRPPVPSEVEKYSLEDRRRLDVLPGLTCIWQVSGRSDIPFDRQVRLDVQYIDSQSFWLDMKLLLRTLPAIILGRGAY